MIVISHPTGNEFSRAIVAGLEQAGLLSRFFTTLSYQNSGLIEVLPPPLKSELLRRTFPAPSEKIDSRPWREAVRLLSMRLHLEGLVRHETGWASLDAVYRSLDISVSTYLKKTQPGNVRGVYCYEDGALRSFQVAKSMGLKCFYDLPIAYWETSRKLLAEEAQRLPEWEPTLAATRDSNEKFARKTEELSLADTVFCPSQFVFDSLPAAAREKKSCVVSEYGSPALPEITSSAIARKNDKLRLLFAGGMTQRKGLADVFAAMKLLGRKDVELVVMGAAVLPMDFYRRQFSDFTYEAPRPHNEVLRLMTSCHALILPSIVEGRALVQQEAMACGLPIIVTPNAGGQDLIEEGNTGFLVPIRSPEALAEKINWLADNISSIEDMGSNARRKAAEITWQRYTEKIISIVRTAITDTACTGKAE